MFFSKRYSKKELKEWINRYEQKVLEFTNDNLIKFVEKVEERLKDKENDLFAIARVTVNQNSDVDLSGEFKKEAVNEILRKARIELKNEAMNVLIANRKYKTIHQSFRE